jgi:hypothetical protein
VPRRRSRCCAFIVYVTVDSVHNIIVMVGLFVLCFGLRLPKEAPNRDSWIKGSVDKSHKKTSDTQILKRSKMEENENTPIIERQQPEPTPQPTDNVNIPHNAPPQAP